MQYRPLGNTNLTVSEIGMGCNRLGESQQTDAFWIDLVLKAIDLGVTLFDTCEAYGWGRSEDILGQAIGNNASVLIADKVSRVRDSGAKDFTADRIVARAEESLRRLHRDRIDIFQLHSPGLDDMQRDNWAEGMARLKAQGKIAVAGVSINDAPSGLWLMENDLVDVMQVAYNLIAPQVGHTLFDLAEAKGVGILVREPMARGVLTGKFSPDQPVAKGHRALLSGDRLPEMIQQAEVYRPIAAEAGIPMGALALRYDLAHKGVSAVIPGARTLEQLQMNVSASDGPPLAQPILDQIAAIQQK